MMVTALSGRVAAVLMMLSASAPAPSVAPSAPGAADPNEILVVGSKATRHAVEAFVDDVTADADGQIAMFEQPICPAAFGLPPAYDRVIEQRIRENAARVGMETAAEPCDANVVVIVADSPAPLVAELQVKRPQMFVGLEFSQVQEVLKTKEPVRSWQAVEPRGVDGRPLQRIMFFNQGPIAGNGAWHNPWTLDSRIAAKIKPRLVSSFVVINADAVDGLTLTQIADYASMRSLARTRFTTALTHRTILQVIDGAERDRSIDQLTAWDLGYLRALYRTSNGVSAHAQQSDIAAVMKRELDGSDVVER
jgi:hypothetical protein